MNIPTGQPIPNLGIGHLAGAEHADADVHYAELDTLANRLGRSMSVHRHDRYFQVHYVASGAVRVHMDESRLYRLDGPMIFLTPPAFAHAFVTEDNASGHVLTVRQPIITDLLNAEPGLVHGQAIAPICLSIEALDGSHREEIHGLTQLFERLRAEFQSRSPARAQALRLLAQLTFISLLRLAPASMPAPPARKDDLALFRAFNTLLEEHFLQHWPIARYCELLNVSDLRLNETCRRVAGCSSKQLVNERLLQESKRLLIFTSHPVAEIAHLLGFKDPAYFSRFFHRLAGQPPGAFRNEAASR
ncbi:4-hydroxyphenylacetate catabolism regulatory protein HpaA [Kerstersia gyiorum]|uniref:4-hydroxyphenylacetate catabolism regulatory protein HpaA n=1 Tax=Kerstersia gyiorum TaxID=206506 RepID=UPI00209DC301|nr:4-hydroxyphenylacetate catabolism regulatory protein HpaA [Kerstersia gyiorum]MCP1669666.1 AraC family 4-hydroxyphenylacetate 3-monooxygenase operon regulatory protein [Kerstersia gyiorum]MCP1707571.1 AraC family 4-hydroxyphenylacetate 3-monooxygenase operon regulatory protein [Kerstersia gyiorum]